MYSQTQIDGVRSLMDLFKIHGSLNDDQCSAFLDWYLPFRASRDINTIAEAILKADGSVVDQMEAKLKEVAGLSPCS